MVVGREVYNCFADLHLATFNEKLLLGNGMIVAPLPNAQSSRSLRDVMGGIDNERDFHSHIVGQRSKVPPKAADIRYEQHPVRLVTRPFKGLLLTVADASLQAADASTTKSSYIIDFHSTTNGSFICRTNTNAPASSTRVSCDTCTIQPNAFFTLSTATASHSASAVQLCSFIPTEWRDQPILPASTSRKVL